VTVVTWKDSAKRILPVVLVLVVAAGAGAVWYGLSNRNAPSSHQNSGRKPNPLQGEVQPVRRGEVAWHVEAQ
jgi:hypothetical protein